MSCLRAGLTRCARPIAPLSTRLGVTFRRQQSTLSRLLSDYRTLQAPYTPQEENRAEWESRRKALRKKLGLYRLLEDVELESLVRALRAGQEGQQDAVDAGDDFDLTPGSGSWNVTRIKGTQSNLAANLEAARVSSGRPKPRFEAEAHALLKQYQFKDWPTGVEFLNQATEVIENQDVSAWAFQTSDALTSAPCPAPPLYPHEARSSRVQITA